MNGSQHIALVANSSRYTYNFRIGLIRLLRKEGIRTTVIAPRDHASGRFIEEEVPFIELPFEPYSMSPLQGLRMVRWLRDCYRQHRFDLVLHYTAKPNIFGTLAAASLGIPSIAITTGLGYLRYPNRPLTGWLLRTLYRVAARYTRELWFLNRDDLRFFLNRKMVDPEKTFILPSEGVDTHWYRPYMREKDWPANRPVRFLFAGRLVRSKGVVEFLEVARRLRQSGANVRFDLVGILSPEHPDGITVAHLQELLRKRYIHYFGEKDDIRPFIEYTDCVVLPSYFGEGVPRILLEAASMGKPIITTDHIGCREVVESGRNGFLCPPRDTACLEQAIRTFLELSEGQRQRMGLNGREKVIREFDEQEVLQHYLGRLSRYFPSLRRPANADHFQE